MRHNLFVLVKTLRAGALPRARRLIGLLAAVLAVASLIGGMAPGALAASSPFSPLAEVSPAAEATVKPIPDQVAVVGKPFSMTIEGTELHEVVATAGLPAELTLSKISETEWKISGEPTAAKSATKVDLEVKNNEEPPTTVSASFNLTVNEPEATPTIETPEDRTGVAGKTIAPIVIKGTNLAHVTATPGLPANLTLAPVGGNSETEWEISGVPASAQGPTEIVLSTENKEKAAGQGTHFSLTVTEPEGLPTLNSPGDQVSTIGKPITPLVITGSHLAKLINGPLPAGLEIQPSGPSEWRITGTPTKLELVVVELVAENSEGAKTPPVTFNWAVEPEIVVPPPIFGGPTASGAPAISPGVVFSAARATCVSPKWSGGTVATQWLLDGAPISGAAAASFVPPRAYDGHALACRQTATAAGSSTSLSSAGRIVHEQPPQPSWPISKAALHCSSAVCMQQGAAPGAVGQAYAQEGAWWGSQQVRCASAPWTSAVGSSAQPAVRALAEAHAVRITLQRISGGGVVTLASQELGNLGAPRDLLDGSPTPFAGTIVAPFGAQPFAAGELWSARFPRAAGRPNWFGPGGGLLVYGVTGAPGAARSFQLTYTLTPADLGSRLRCVAGADDGPVSAPTKASFSSPDYAIATTATCGPRRLGAASLPQPALIVAGEPRCIPAPSSLASLGTTPREVAVKGARAAIALSCNLHGGCRGKLALTAVLGGKRTALGRAAARVGGGAVRVISLKLNGRGKRALKAAGTRGLAASVQLESRRHTSRLASVRLLRAG